MNMDAQMRITKKHPMQELELHGYIINLFHIFHGFHCKPVLNN